MQRWQSRNATWLRDYRQALKDVKTDAVLATIRATGRAASSRVATDNRWTEINETPETPETPETAETAETRVVRLIA